MNGSGLGLCPVVDSDISSVYPSCSVVILLRLLSNQRK
jgi:hypothetical protein